MPFCLTRAVTRSMIDSCYTPLNLAPRDAPRRRARLRSRGLCNCSTAFSKSRVWTRSAPRVVLCSSSYRTSLTVGPYLMQGRGACPYLRYTHVPPSCRPKRLLVGISLLFLGVAAGPYRWPAFAAWTECAIMSHVHTKQQTPCFAGPSSPALGNTLQGYLAHRK